MIQKGNTITKGFCKVLVFCTTCSSRITVDNARDEADAMRQLEGSSFLRSHAGCKGKLEQHIPKEYDRRSEA